MDEQHMGLERDYFTNFVKKIEICAKCVRLNEAHVASVSAVLL